MNILIVDDTPINLKLLRVQLEDEGHAVFEAHNGVDALALLERQRVDVVISDIFMPEMDGYRLSYEIRKHARLHDLPIILCTSTYTSPGDEKLVRDVGADKYLKKPVSLETIVAALHEVIAMPHAAPQPKAMQEVEVLKEYSERLVSKLEEKNTELQAQTEALSAEVAERKRAEKRFHTLFEFAPDAIVMIDQQGIITLVNRQAETVFGYPRDELLGQPVEMLMPVAFRRAHVDLRQGFLGNAMPRTMGVDRADLLGLRKDGTTFPVDISLSPMELEGGIVVAAAVRDVTQRLQSEAALRESAERLRFAMQASNVGLWDWDTRTNQVIYSREWKSQLGYEETEIRNEFSEWERLVHPDDLAAAQQRIQRYLARPEGAYEAEFRMCHKDGTWRWIYARGEFFRDASGEAVRMMGCHIDLTEHKQDQEEILHLNAELEDRVQRRTAQLQAANQELEAFSYSVSHDLRTPLSSIDGYSGLLGKEIGASAASERSKHYLTRIRAGVVQMGELIDALLSLAQVSRTSLLWESVDLSAMAETVLNAYRERDPDRVAQLAIQPGLVVQGDPRLLRQVLDNLLGNAWKFSGQQPQTHIAFGRENGPDGQAVYAVRDKGAGFDMAYSEKLFGPFQRLHSVPEFAGTGIGLATVHRIITRHGGKVWAESAPGQGATFYFTLGRPTGS